MKGSFRIALDRVFKRPWPRFFGLVDGRCGFHNRELRVRSDPKVTSPPQCDPKKPAKSRAEPPGFYLKSITPDLSSRDNRQANLKSLVRSNEFLPYIAQRVTVAFGYTLFEAFPLLSVIKKV